MRDQDVFCAKINLARATEYLRADIALRHLDMTAVDISALFRLL
jgi:hypothetical protein